MAPTLVTPPAEETHAAPGPAPVEPRRLVLGDALIADVVGESGPPVALGETAVKLYAVELLPIVDPKGLQPMWVMKAPDGRLWPPDAQTQLGLYAGETPQIDPVQTLLYSDHIDGLMPLYEIPRGEAYLHAARENEAALLYVNRAVYDQRREFWQEAARSWRWTWYVRQIDLAQGEALVACLSDLSRSRRAPEGFTSEAAAEVFLLDEAGVRVEAVTPSLEQAETILGTLGDAASGISVGDPAELAGELAKRGAPGLGMWRAPAPGRYQVWAALGMDTGTARCKVWTAKP